MHDMWDVTGRNLHTAVAVLIIADTWLHSEESLLVEPNLALDQFGQ